MELVTDRLVLREFVKDDWRAVLVFQLDLRNQQFYPTTERTLQKARNIPTRRFYPTNIPQISHKGILSHKDGKLKGES
jgi:hypothetical protein